MALRIKLVLIAFLFAAPFIKVNGIQFILFNVLERKFNIFGFPFFPQDFHLFALSIALSVVFIILFTVVFGRIFVVGCVRKLFLWK
jgi:polyferredoxin